MRAKLFSALMVAAVVGATVSANAQVAISQDGRPERMASIKLVTGLNSADSKMLQKIYWGNAFEIKASEIAQKRGQSAWSKQYSEEMIHEHTMAQNELKLLAMDKGFNLSNNIPQEMIWKLNKLRNTSQSSFDSMYRAEIMGSHAQASLMLQKAIKGGHDEEVRSFAIKLLPTVKDHYTLAQIRRTMMGSTKTQNGV